MTENAYYSIACNTMHHSQGKTTMFWTKRTLCMLFVVLVLATETTYAHPRIHTKIIEVEGNVKSDYQVTPQNQAATHDRTESVEFSCQPSNEAEVVMWSRQVEGSAQEDTIAVDGVIAPGYENKYRIINETTIAVLNVTINDGQRLRCGLMGATVSAHAYLLVIGSDSRYCNGTRMYLGEEGYYRCVWPYHGLNGLWSPVMQCFLQQSGQNISSRNITVSQQEIDYIAEFVVEEQLDGQQYGWRVYYESPPAGAIPDTDLQNIYSTSVPDLVHTTSLNRETIWYGPHKVHIYPKSSQYSVGDVVTCEAAAYLSPNFLWAIDHDNASYILSDSSVLNITDNMVGMSGKLNCVANNIINLSTEERTGKSTESVNATIKVEANYKQHFMEWPVNQVALIGESVVVNCTVVSTTDVLYWATQLQSSSVENNVIYDGQVIPGYEGQYDIVGQSSILVKYAEAQRLKCGLMLAAISMHAYLITLESEPMCRHNSTSVNDIQNGTDVHIYCQVTYNGLWAPAMTWGRMNVRGDNWDLDDVAVNESFDKTVRSSLYLKLDSSHNRTVFMCKTHFLPPPDGVLPDDDGNTVINRYAPSWTYYYKTERFYVP